MKKVAILTDTNCGISKKEADSIGLHVLPMPFYIDEEVYYEGVDLTQEEFYQRLKSDCEIKTSMPVVGDVLDKWDELLSEYEEVIYIPMSSGLSGSCESAIMLSQDDDYEDKVFVVNNQRVSVTMKESVMDALLMADKGYSAQEIKDTLEEHKMESSIYISLDTLKYLSKGGRLTPAAATFGQLLHIKPVLTIQGEKLDQFAKAMSVKQAKNIMLDAIDNDINNRFGGNPEDVVIAVAHTANDKQAELLKEEVLNRWPNREVVLDPLPLSIACHIGPGSLAVTVGKRIKLD